MKERERAGSRPSSRLRRAGLVPGVLYGRGKKPHAIAVPERTLRSVLAGPHGRHAILDVVLEGQKTSHASILKDFQVDPIRGRITHFDLHEVRLDEVITAQVALELVGEAPGVRQGGVLSALVREVTVEALPLGVPDRLQLDLSGAEIGATLRVADLEAPDGVRILDDPDTVIATIAAPRAVEVEEAVEAAEEAPEGAAEQPPGEAAAAEATGSEAGPSSVEG